SRPTLKRSVRLAIWLCRPHCWPPDFTNTTAGNGESAVSDKPPNKTNPMPHDELVKLVHSAQSGDEKALPALRELLKEPHFVEIFGGNLARLAQHTLIRKYSGKNLLSSETLIRKVEIMRDELAGPSPTPLERLLVERIVTCWLHLHQLEAIYSNMDSIEL